MNCNRQPVLRAACKGGDMQEASDKPKPPAFAFPDAFSERLWKSMRLSPKTLACEKDFYLKALHVPEKARIVWQCVSAQGSNGRIGKNGKTKNKTKLREPLGPLEFDGGNLAFSAAKSVEPSRKRKVVSCTQEMGVAGRLASAQSAGSNIHCVSRRDNGPDSSANRQHKIRRSAPPEDTSNHSNSCHRMMRSSSSGGTMEHASSKSEWKSSGGSMNNLSAHGSVALSQNGDAGCLGGTTDVDLVRNGSFPRRNDPKEPCKAAHDDVYVEQIPTPFHNKLQQLVINPSTLSDGPSTPRRMGMEDRAGVKTQEATAMNDEEVAMQLHQVLNAPALRSRARRNGTSTSVPPAHADSAKNSMTKICHGSSLVDCSGSQNSDSDRSCLLKGKRV